MFRNVVDLRLLPHGVFEFRAAARSNWQLHHEREIRENIYSKVLLTCAGYFPDLPSEAGSAVNIIFSEG